MSLTATLTRLRKTIVVSRTVAVETDRRSAAAMISNISARPTSSNKNGDERGCIDDQRRLVIYSGRPSSPYPMISSELRESRIGSAHVARMMRSTFAISTGRGAGDANCPASSLVASSTETIATSGRPLRFTRSRSPARTSSAISTKRRRTYDNVAWRERAAPGRGIPRYGVRRWHAHDGLMRCYGSSLAATSFVRLAPSLLKCVRTALVWECPATKHARCLFRCLLWRSR